MLRSYRSATLFAISLLAPGCVEYAAPETVPVSLSAVKRPAPGGTEVLVEGVTDTVRITQVAFVLEMHAESMPVDLALDDSPPVRLTGVRMHPGTYTELPVELSAVHVTGDYRWIDGVPHPFTFVSDVDIPIDLLLGTSLVLDKETQNLTISVDVARWFVDREGMVMDPRVGAYAGAIEDNLRRSFLAFPDNDGDGTDDRTAP